MRFVKYLLLLSILLIFTGCFPGYGDDDGNIQPDNTYGWEKLALGSICDF